MNEHERERELRSLTSAEIAVILGNVLEGRSPGSRANVFAAAPREWVNLACELALLGRVLFERLAAMTKARDALGVIAEHLSMVTDDHHGVEGGDCEACKREHRIAELRGVGA